MSSSKVNIAFFGTPDIAVWVLEELECAGIVPSLVITNPDAPQGRKMVLTPPPAKVWAINNGTPFLQPATLKDELVQKKLSENSYDLFIVAAYGKIIPKVILDIPCHGTLNVHPSLLPRFRGASPIRSAILADERETGVTIMLMDEKLDHGPILAQESASITKDEWPLPGKILDERLARQGGKLLASVIPSWSAQTLTPQVQDETQATFCTKITKEMGEINLKDDPYQNLLKIRAFNGWPGTFFFYEKNGKKMRVKIIEAGLDTNGILQILRVIPEGKNEMSYTDFSATMK